MKQRLPGQPRNQIHIQVGDSSRAQPPQIRLNRCPAVQAPARMRLASTNDCTPRLTRFTPAAAIASSIASANCPGAHSTVISASASSGNSARIAANSFASNSGASRLGVPPPRYTVSTRRGSSSSQPRGPSSSAGQVLDHPLHIARMIAGRIHSRSKVAVGALRPAKGDGNVNPERIVRAVASS